MENTLPTRAHVIDALRRERGETLAEMASRLNISKRTAVRYVNDDSFVTDRVLTKVLIAYDVTKEHAYEIASGHAPLKPSAVDTELRRRQAIQQIEDNKGRDPRTRKPGEHRWWLANGSYFFKGSQELVGNTPDQRVFSVGPSVIIATIDARLKHGLGTSEEEIIASCMEYDKVRTLNQVKTNWPKYFDFLKSENVLKLENGNFSLGDEIENSILRMPIGDPRTTYPPINPKQGKHCEYLPFKDRYPVLEDFIGRDDPIETNEYLAIKTMNEGRGVVEEATIEADEATVVAVEEAVGVTEDLV